MNEIIMTKIKVKIFIAKVKMAKLKMVKLTMNK
jgi:hypothetical protein